MLSWEAGMTFAVWLAMLGILAVVLQHDIHSAAAQPATLVPGMGRLHHQIATGNADAQKFFDQGLMDLHPWQLWSSDGTPAAGTEEIVRVLESVLQRDPLHVGANHYYIHAVEASKAPDRALAS